MSTRVYDWQAGNFSWADRFTADRPVPERTFIFDLLHGDMHFVDEVSDAAPPELPRALMRTRVAGILSEEKLAALRERAGYIAGDCALPLDQMVFFTDRTELREFLK
ncbi:MAG: hypothetical protein ACRD41_17665 [Candidatus Acidiferrales bacterium]